MAMAAERALGMRKVFVDTFLQKAGLGVDEDIYRRLLVTTNRALKQGAALYLRPMDGDWRPDPDVERFPPLRLPEPGKPPSTAVDVGTFWGKVSVA